ncbi:SGNH/GDSL hydrolase family protein [Candidatus Fermentibacterales bacterium]|nr:SGNH/GDSL hydrolase family protein [Candidatus Fermentibacterales bacterium]
MSSRAVRTVTVALLLSGAIVVLLALLGSRSDRPAVAGRYSLRLALPLGLYAVSLAAVLAAFLARFGRAFEALAGLISGLGRLPGILEIGVLCGWMPVAFLALAGPGFAAIAGNGGFLRGLLVLYAGFVMCVPVSLERQRRRALLERVTVLGVAMVLGLAGLEVTLRALMPGSVFHSSIELRPYQRLVLDVDLPGMSSRAIHTTNAWGLRGEEPPLEEWDDWLTIVTVGGSTTHCYYMDDSRTWSAVLQRELRGQRPDTWVGNGGLSGHSTRGHVLFMRDIIPVISPDIVVLLVGTNDVVYSTRGEGGAEGIRSAESSGLPHRILASSRLAQVVWLWMRGTFGGEHMMTENLAPYEPLPLRGEELEVPEDITELCTSLDQYRENILTIIELGRQAGVTTVFMTQPSRWEDTEYWRGVQASYYWEESGARRMSAATVWRILDVFNLELLAVCAEQDVPCLDLAAVVPHSEDYFYDAMHFTEAGAELVGRSLAAFLKERGLAE